MAYGDVTGRDTAWRMSFGLGELDNVERSGINDLELYLIYLESSFVVSDIRPCVWRDLWMCRYYTAREIWSSNISLGYCDIVRCATQFDDVDLILKFIISRNGMRRFSLYRGIVSYQPTGSSRFDLRGQFVRLCSVYTYACSTFSSLDGAQRYGRVQIYWMKIAPSASCSSSPGLHERIPDEFTLVQQPRMMRNSL